MSSGFLVYALAGIAGLTSLTVQALKKLLDEKGAKYSSNLLAVVVAVILTAAVSWGYVIYNSVTVTPQVCITMIALMYLSFLSATVGFDKVKQLIEQLKA